MLHVAVFSNNIKIIVFLLENGADCSVKDKNGRTPLHLACRWDYFGIIAFLLEKGADINIKDNYGKTCLDLVNDVDGRNKINDILELIKLR